MLENEVYESQIDDGQEQVVDAQEVEESAEHQTEGAQEEVAEPQKSVQSAEENAKFANIRREAEERARQRAQSEYDRQIAELYGDYGIKSFEELKQAMQAQREQERLEKLLEENIPEEYAKEIIENRKFREQYQSEKTASELQARTQAMFNEFLSTFPEVNASDIPQQVWEMVDSGKNLTDAYALYQIKNIDQFKIKAQQEAIKAIKDNSDTSTGSITSGAAGEQSSMSVDQVNQLLSSMTAQDQSKWIDSNMKNLEKWGYFKKF